MDKFYERTVYAVGAISLVAAMSLGKSPTSAQESNNPIKFGQKGGLTYEVSHRPYSDEQLDMSFFKERQGKSWGHIHPFAKNSNVHTATEKFLLHGVLEEGTGFSYMTDGFRNFLVLTRNGVQLGFWDYNNKNADMELINDMDSANVSGIEVNLGSTKFYESPRPAPQEKAKDLNGRLHDLYSKHMQWLNTSAVESAVEKTNAKADLQRLNLTLDNFVR